MHIDRPLALAILAVALGAGPTPASDTTLTLWANQAIKMSGSANTFCGWAHSNGTVEIGGSANTFTGPVEYVVGFKGTGNFTPILTPPAPAPTPAHSVADYRALAQSQGTYFGGSGDVKVNGSTLSGVVFAEGDLHLSASDVTGHATFVSAHGQVTLQGNRNHLTPAVDGVLAFAPQKTVAISGKGQHYDGALYLPVGDFNAAWSSDSTVTGPIIARNIAWSKSNTQFGGQCCTTDAACDDGDACTTDTCNRGACQWMPDPSCSTVPSCLSGAGPLVTLSGTRSTAYVNRSMAAGTAIDARAVTFLASPTNRYPINLGGGVGCCIFGGAVLGQYDRTWAWDQMESTNNAAIAFVNGGFTVDGLRVDNVTDGIRPQPGAGFTVRDVWLSYVRDDCVENDHLEGGLIDDSLFDGCYNAFSARPSQAIIDEGFNGSNELWTIQNSLVRLQPMPGPDGPSTSDGLGNAGFFKWHKWDTPTASLSPKLALYNNVFMAERVGQSGAKRMGIPPGQLRGCANNVMVWLGPGAFPAPLPDCFTVTTDRTVWDTAVAAWLARHGVAP